MSRDVKELRTELGELAMRVAQLLTQEGGDEAAVAELDRRRDRLREAIREAEAPARAARQEAACIHRPG